jgi:hypothetical protein
MSIAPLTRLACTGGLVTLQSATRVADRIARTIDARADDVPYSNVGVESARIDARIEDGDTLAAGNGCSPSFRFGT